MNVSIRTDLLMDLLSQVRHSRLLLRIVRRSREIPRNMVSHVIDYSLYDSTRVLSVATYSEIRSCGRSWPTLPLIM